MHKWCKVTRLVCIQIFSDTALTIYGTVAESNCASALFCGVAFLLHLTSLVILSLTKIHCVCWILSWPYQPTEIFCIGQRTPSISYKCPIHNN